VPVSPAVTDEYTTTEAGDPQSGSIPAEYAALVATLLALLVAAVTPTPGMSWPSWAMQSLVRGARLRSGVLSALARLDVVGLARRALEGVTTAAQAAAVDDVRWRGGLPGVEGWRVAALADALRATHPRISQVIGEALRACVDAVTGAQGDPGPAVQRILDDLAARGVTGFVDANGRRWNLETYVETVVRSHLAQAAMDAYVAVLRDTGVRFAQVGGPPRSGCERACRKWSAQYVSLDGSPAGDYDVFISGSARRIHVLGTMQQARTEGVWHPWCGHPLGPPALSRRSRRRTSKAERATSRYRGRHARAWERRERVGITPQARQEAGRRATWWRRKRARG
jgi:hypothetical protein